MHTDTYEDTEQGNNLFHFYTISWLNRKLVKSYYKEKHLASILTQNLLQMLFPMLHL